MERGRRLWKTWKIGHDDILKESIPPAQGKREQQNGDGTKVRVEPLHYT
jgi:hypothetical protein